MKKDASIILDESLVSKIYFIREQKVMLDRDLAELYGVLTKNLNKAVKRNIERFPPDFMFKLTKDESDSLRFQFGTLKRGAHSKFLPFVFTEQGVAMLSFVRVPIAIGKNASFLIWLFLKPHCLILIG